MTTNIIFGFYIFYGECEVQNGILKTSTKSVFHVDFILDLDINLRFYRWFKNSVQTRFESKWQIFKFLCIQSVIKNCLERMNRSVLILRAFISTNMIGRVIYRTFMRKKPAEHQFWSKDQHFNFRQTGKPSLNILSEIEQ